ncbi:BnaUnng04510D [Brassica napus]|uniref:BnaUnng04510D protein n=2 Tax=Brassica TaxID=3705 RepID=A0A078K1M2_BRANA|nr:BnaUnng04510D [Brassica napus]VDD26792.1 unnamed protein product [Brassica rapa]
MPPFICLPPSLLFREAFYDYKGRSKKSRNEAASLIAPEGEGFLKKFDSWRGGFKFLGRAVNTYIIASHQLEAGKMVMNCDWSKPSTSSFSQSAQNDHPKPLFTV